VLRQRAIQQGVAECVTTVKGSIDALPFASGELDLIWSEGAIYNIGFENGIAQWRRYLKPGGVLVVSEIIWTTGTRPLKIQRPIGRRCIRRSTSLL